MVFSLNIRNFRDSERCPTPKTSHDFHGSFGRGMLRSVCFEILGNDLFGFRVNVQHLAKMVLNPSQDFFP